MSRKRLKHFWMWGLVTGLLLLPTSLPTSAEEAAAPAHGEAPAKAEGHGAKPDGEKKEGGGEGEAKGEGEGKGEAAVHYALDPPLNGRFDIKVFRREDKVREFRVEVPGIEEYIGTRNDWKVKLALVVEFGGGSGVTELQGCLAQAKIDIQKALQAFEGRELLRPEGKDRLKQDLIDTLNRRLRTAQVRQVYLTEYLLTRLTRKGD
jgi:hypothetical protein